MVFPGEKEEARQEEADIQPGDANVKKSASFTAKQNDGTVKETITPEQRGFEKHDQRKIIRQLELLGVGTAGSLQSWVLRDDLDRKNDKGRDNMGRYTESAQTAERLAGIFGNK